MSVDYSILTYTGRYICLAEPRDVDFHISDIAHALSQICRFGGHTRQFYSVAQHSVLVSQMVPVDYRLQALLHDAAEAYFGDMVQPLKRMEALQHYRDYEQSMQSRLFEAFGVIPTTHSTEAVKRADLEMLATERRDLMAPDMAPWSILEGVEPRRASITPVMPQSAEILFIKRFKELAGVL
ncbi:hypothetical protein [Collimonas pratensis]|uniref:Phosphohydrolase n=1 Tax=Collimonas pratensis TaxID=279113 RepID=A0ABN4M635_9BURK|nr:hypothetical protein [Collimonas pratensis]AMP13698.1 hypothetical protein CPter291_1424 [Collimonas pratensis]